MTLRTTTLSKITGRSQDQGCGLQKVGHLIQKSTATDDGTWKVWDPLVEDWCDLPSERSVPLARPIEFQHTKRVGALMLHVYRDIDGTIIGKFFKPTTT
jgi:hypothetical protein